MTADSPRDDGLEWALSGGIGALAEKMGFEWVTFTADRAVARMPVDGNTQPVGLFHGGGYVVLGESLGSMHANFLAGPGRLAVGVDINATHTRSLAVHEIAVTDDQGRRCSTIRITNMIKDR